MSRAAAALKTVASAYAFVKTIVDEITGERAIAHETLVDLTFGRGLIILDEMPHPKQSLEEYLRRQYFGLWLIGRAGKRLHIVKKTEISTRLGHFHAQLNREQDRILVQWYETAGVSRRVPLHKALGYCPEIIELGIDGRFIAFALGDQITLDFTGLKADLEKFR